MLNIVHIFLAGEYDSEWNPPALLSSCDDDEENCEECQIGEPWHSGLHTITFGSSWLAAVHNNTAIWGADANEFDPMRFSEPRKHFASFVPFGLGSIICVAHNLAMVEAKIAISMIIRQFTFSVSPSYVHAPMLSHKLQPEFGAHILFRRISSWKFSGVSA